MAAHTAGTAWREVSAVRFEALEELADLQRAFRDGDRQDYLHVAPIDADRRLDSWLARAS